MSSVANEVFPAGMYGFVQIKPDDTPGTAGNKIAVSGKHYRWPVIFFDHPAGYNTYYTFMPVVFEYNSSFFIDQYLLSEKNIILTT